MCSKLFDTKLNFEMRKNKKTLADWLHEFMNYILVFFLRFFGKEGASKENFDEKICSGGRASKILRKPSKYLGKG